MYFHLSVECSSKDMHSGVIGGSVHEAMTDLVHLMGSLVTPDGTITIAGIDEQIAPLTEKEKAQVAAAAADFDLGTYKVDVGVDGVTDTL
jgi:hypothetical protein